ncbi:MAG: hypothetical protein AAFV07_04100, partial [Bacteroidota bacterium]
MANRNPLLWLSTLALLCSAFLFQSCVRDRCNMEYTYARYTPVYLSSTEFVSAVEVQPARAMVNPGKIFLKDQYLFINEVAKGIHIFDNQNPESPQALAFLNVPGNYEIAFNCDKLYLDSSKDLLVFDMKDPAQPQLIYRLPNALPHITQYQGYNADPNKGVVVEWVREVVTEPYNCETGIPAVWEVNAVDPAEAQSATNTTRSINPATPGKAGSMSRMASLGDHLYVILADQMRIFDVANCSDPSMVGEQPLAVGEAEMVSTLNNYLLVGGTAGVSFYDASIPTQPEFLSRFDHMQACDPVVAQGDYAYITLRDGREIRCGNNFTNQLDIVNISEIRSPRLMQSVMLHNPHGLGVDGDLLFVADAAEGIKIFDISQPDQVRGQQISHLKGVDGFD